ncbi:MAG: HEAT repeat domain-containing protein [Pirellulaceae bacterium]
MIFRVSFVFVVPVLCSIALAQTPRNPFDEQVFRQLQRLESPTATVRAGAATALGFLRAYSAEDALTAALGDRHADVRQQAALALAWSGGRRAVPPLIAALQDPDWVTRQAAHVALTNITGQEFPFDASADGAARFAQVEAWQNWWSHLPENEAPEDLLIMLSGSHCLLQAGTVTASTTYKGPADVLLDRQIGPAYWQTKNVAPPQWVTIDMGEPRSISRVVVHQYGEQYAMTGYELALSLDNAHYDVVRQEEGVTPAVLEIRFPERIARHVRITSTGSVNPTYPTTFFEVEIDGFRIPGGDAESSPEWRFERAVRALGALGGRGASEAVIECLGDVPPELPRYRPLVRAAIRALGRLREEEGFQQLLSLLDNPLYARNAADALGDYGDPRAVSALLAVYPRYAKQCDGADPADVPRDDFMSFPSEDRMLETPYTISYALCRLPWDAAARQQLRALAPLIMANLPGDFDTFLLYEPEVHHLLTRHLIDGSGLRQEAVEWAFTRLGQPRRIPEGENPAVWPRWEAYRMSTWLPTLCQDPADLPRLLALMEHEEGWVRLNAAKAIAWLGERAAIEPLAKMLREAKAEAEFGYSGTFKNEEYNDPAPRWREGLIRALGLLEAHEHTDLIIAILNDEQSVLEVRRAAADSLADLGNEKALTALRHAALYHDFHSIRHVARDALRARGENVERVTVDGETDLGLAGNAAHPAESASRDIAEHATAPTDDSPHDFLKDSTDRSSAAPDDIQAVVFIQGSNNIPNTIGTVEQADRWRQTYVVTDSGPAYRPGDNLFVLRPPQPAGEVVPLTRFQDGYVAEPEVSWDATHVLFTRRGQDDPWWHVYRINIDGSALTQLTHGPYHHVGPAYLPDGKIVLATSRGGIRDEYHAYPCTALWVMNADGSDLHPISTNIGRDNEPAILQDGRIVFSRLEVFYSRNKTELTLHAMHPCGAQDVVLYGPERRAFWRDLDHGPRTPADEQEAPLTHRVLRMTQPQPMPDGRGILTVTQGGLTLIGARRDSETIISPDNHTRSYTTPFPLADGRILCASTLKTPNRHEVDIGLYVLHPADGRLELMYNDPARAEFEPRPIRARRPPQRRTPVAQRQAYSGRFFCASVFNTQEPDVRERGRLVRLIEGVPMVARHSTHTNPWEVWQNHGGTFARVLGMAPLAADGSFFVEVPADRLLHFQVLDSDRRVLGNQLTWIYPRPGETKSCAGCHENPHTTPGDTNPIAARYPPLSFLPDGDEFTYRAKAWFKGSLPPEIEERTRTVRAVNLLGR